MTIPELMYGAGRYSAPGYLRDDFAYRYGQNANGSTTKTMFATIAIRIPAWPIVWAILLVIFGLLAIALPLLTSFGVVRIIGWLLILTSAIRLIHAFQSRDIATMLSKLTVSLLYWEVGIYFLVHSFLGIVSLALAIGFLFTAEAAFDFFGHSRTRKSIGSCWLLFDGIGSLALGLLIWRQWLSSFPWAIGPLVGVSMLIMGLTRLMIVLAACKRGEAYID